MATTNPCKRCSQQVSIWVRNCPHCGISSPTTTTKQMAGGIIVLMFFGWMLSMALSDSPSDRGNLAEKSGLGQKPAAIRPYDVNYIYKPVIGCRSKEAWDKATNSGKYPAWNPQFERRYATATTPCLNFKIGNTVYVEGIEDGNFQKVKFGASGIWWVPKENISGAESPFNQDDFE